MNSCSYSFVLNIFKYKEMKKKLLQKHHNHLISLFLSVFMFVIFFSLKLEQQLTVFDDKNMKKTKIEE